MLKALFIGGSKDGQFVDVTGAELVIPRKPPMVTPLHIFESPTIIEMVPMLYERYQLQQFRYANNDFGYDQYYFYVYRGGPLIDVMERLITVYHADYWAKGENNV